MKPSGIKHDGRAANTVPVAAVEALGSIKVTDRPLLPDPDPGPLPPLLGDAAPDPGVDDAILSRKFRNVLEFF